MGGRQISEAILQQEDKCVNHIYKKNIFILMSVLSLNKGLGFLDNTAMPE